MSNLEDFIIRDNVLIKYNGKAKDVTIPEGVGGIMRNTFFNCDIKKVVFPCSLRDTGDYTFENHINLEEIVIQEGVRYIGSGTFHGCKSLVHVVLPNSITYIGENAFADCESLETVKVMGELDCIKKLAFNDCINLREFHLLNKSATAHFTATFGGCTKITLYGYSGSTLEEYAKFKNIPFKILENNLLNPYCVEFIKGLIAPAIFNGMNPMEKGKVIYTEFICDRDYYISRFLQKNLITQEDVAGLKTLC